MIAKIGTKLMRMKATIQKTWSNPSTTTNIRSYIGQLQILGRFIPNFGDVAALLAFFIKKSEDSTNVINVATKLLYKRQPYVRQRFWRGQTGRSPFEVMSVLSRPPLVGPKRSRTVTVETERSHSYRRNICIQRWITLPMPTGRLELSDLLTELNTTFKDSHLRCLPTTMFSKRFCNAKAKQV